MTIGLYRLVQKKRNVLLSTSLAWPAVAGSRRAETFSQLSSNKFTPHCKVNPNQGSDQIENPVLFEIEQPN